MSGTQKGNQWRNLSRKLKGNIEGAKNTEMDHFAGWVFDWWRRVDAHDEIEEKDHQWKV